MFRNFFRTAFRNMAKHRSYAVINFSGLTSGLALALLIITYVRSELRYDHHHEKLQRLYRLSYSVPNGLQLATTPPPIAPKMTDFFPEIEAAARIYGRGISLSRPERDDLFVEETVYFADSTLTDLFTFSFVHGNPELALKEKFTVILSEEVAKRYFGNEDPVGQTFLFNNAHLFRVTGVFRDYPDDAHLAPDIIVPYENMYDLEPPTAAEVMRRNFEINYVISHSYTYVLLKPGADPEGVNARMDEFVKKFAPPALQVGQQFSLMPVADIHLKSTLLAEPTPANSFDNIIIFTGVGLLTLLIASINYINLSTAQSLTRLREIGIRKILGSQKSQLIFQFLAESFLFCLVSLVLAYGVFYTVLPFLNEVTGKHLVFSEVVDGPMLMASFILLLVITLLAGGYPAWFVTRFDSINALKGQTSGSGGNQFMRRVLVVFQLTIAFCLLTGSVLIVRQLRFLTDRPLGFTKERMITIPLFNSNVNGIFRNRDSTLDSRIEAFRHAVEAQAGVMGTALSSSPPGLGAMYRGTIPEGFAAEDNMFVANYSVGHDFLETFDMKLVAGRAFTPHSTGDMTSSFIVNETAVREFNWGSPQEALGRTIDREGKKGQVIGVVGDFHFVSLTTPISAIILEMDPTQFATMSIRIAGTDTEALIRSLESLWKASFPEKAFEYNFLDEQLSEQYATFLNFGLIIQSFTLVAIVIACLGVYGLILFVVQRKVREIGVRKVLGANVGNILVMIFRDFSLLLIIGYLLAIPASYLLLDRWLSNFTYRVSIDIVTYIFSLLVLASVVFSTIAYQAVKASLANPVKSLRTE